MSRPYRERRMLQFAVAAACIVPLTASLTGIVLGADWLQRTSAATDMDSHFRYLSGIFLMMAVAFAGCIPRIDRCGERFRLLSAMVVTGGIARFVSLLLVGPPSFGHVAGLCIELGIVPMLVIGQARLERRWKRA